MVLRRLSATLSLVALVIGLTACEPITEAGGEPEPSVEPTTAPAEPTPEPTPDPSPAPEPSPTPTPSEEPVRFVAVVDGDTVETSVGTVRIIGIDTPERGECGHDEASMTIGRLIAPGDEVELVYPAGQNDSDAYDRLLRYVRTADGVDVGMAQLQAGNAVARYDSSDGYPEHPLEADYHAAQVAALGDDGRVVTTDCEVEAPPSSAALVDVPEEGDGEQPWYMKYGSCSRLKKNTVGDPTGPFDVNDPDEVDIYNWFQYGTGHSGDGDNDGRACE